LGKQVKNDQTFQMVIQEAESERFDRFSSYVQAVRTTARILRFVARCRKQPVESGYLSKGELNEAALLIACSSQQFHFSTLLHELSQGRAASGRLLARLRPFLDNENTIRVGGRLSRSDLPDDQNILYWWQRHHISVVVIK